MIVYAILDEKDGRLVDLFTTPAEAHIETYKLREDGKYDGITLTVVPWPVHEES